jgi:signal peptidase I
MQEYFTEAYPDTEPENQQRTKRGLGRTLLDIFETVLLSILLFLAINTISARIRVESISMQPTLYDGDFVVVNKLAYKIGSPTRGDIVIFRYPPDPNKEPYIKRIIGLPGDVVGARNQTIYINGVALDEPYISAPPSYNGEWIVPEDSIFVLGDNRNHSSDSHSWGMVPIDNVLGKALVVYLPVAHWQVLGGESAMAAEP